MPEDKTPKNQSNNRQEPLNCSFPRDKVNSRAAKQWMRNQTRGGQSENLSANKRTLLRLFGAKKS